MSVVGILVAELDEHVKRGPKWYEIRRGTATGSAAPKTATSVADDLHAVTEEVVTRISAVENAPAAEVQHA